MGKRAYGTTLPVPRATAATLARDKEWREPTAVSPVLGRGHQVGSGTNRDNQEGGNVTARSEKTLTGLVGHETDRDTTPWIVN